MLYSLVTSAVFLFCLANTMLQHESFNKKADKAFNSYTKDVCYTGIYSNLNPHYLMYKRNSRIASVCLLSSILSAYFLYKELQDVYNLIIA